MPGNYHQFCFKADLKAQNARELPFILHFGKSEGKQDSEITINFANSSILKVNSVQKLPSILLFSYSEGKSEFANAFQASNSLLSMAIACFFQKK